MALDRPRAMSFSDSKHQSEPLVCCVMLTADRPELTRQAVACFKEQTYERKALFILDTGKRAARTGIREGHVWMPDEAGQTIGHLRNLANFTATAHSSRGPDIFAHWDSDDWSHPYRLAEQVDDLLKKKAECVGYGDMVFWWEERREAWLYRSDPLGSELVGTSLMYWRRVWRDRPFENLSEGEDRRFYAGLRSASTAGHKEPRMIARVHGSNSVCTDERFRQWTSDPTSRNWKRSREMDDYCRRVFTPAAVATVSL